MDENLVCAKRKHNNNNNNNNNNNKRKKQTKIPPKNKYSAKQHIIIKERQRNQKTMLDTYYQYSMSQLILSSLFVYYCMI